MVTKNLFQKWMVCALIMLICLPCTDIAAQSYRDLHNATRSIRQQRERSKRNQEVLKELFSNKGKRNKKEKDKAKEDASTSPLANGDVELVVFADGVTKEQAIQTALRSAIEQAFGVFVSSHTEILNDSLVQDEIATVASGNIKSYECLSENYTNGKYFVNVKAIVSTNNLINYTKSKGGSAELAGSSFAMDIRMKELNKENEVKVMKHLAFQLAEITPLLFDFNVELGEVVKEGSVYTCPILIKALINKNAGIMYEMLTNTLEALTLSSFEYEQLHKMGLDGRRVTIDCGSLGKKKYYLRADHSKMFAYLAAWEQLCARCFKLTDNFGSYETEFIPPKSPISDYTFYTERYMEFPCDHIQLDVCDGFRNGSLMFTNYNDSGRGFGHIFIPWKPYFNPNTGGTTDDFNLIPHDAVMQGAIYFSSLDTLSKFSNITIERVDPKMSFSNFMKEVFNIE